MVIYQLLMVLALPVLVLVALRRGGLAERLGLVPAPGPGAGPRLWLHGASNGELTSARWVLEGVIAARPGVQVLVTANSATGRAMVAGWGLPGVVSAYAPLDTAGAPGRVLDRWEPQALVVIENELWPSRIAAARRRGVAVLVIGARMSERSAARWRLLDGLIRSTLARVTWASAQDDGSLARLRALGLPEAAAGPVVALKAQGAAVPGALPFAGPPRARVLLAASTHEGEEEIALDGFLAARGQFDLLILAPRHPRRSPEVQEMLDRRGVAFTTRARGEPPRQAVYLADTLGEMAGWYAMAGVCLIGGTFAPRGGHTPWEPARAGCALLHGPEVENFAGPLTRLDAGGGALRIAQPQDLGAALAGMTPARQAALAARASQLLSPEGDGAEVLRAVLRALDGKAA